MDQLWQDRLKFDADLEINKISDFIRKVIENSGSSGVVLGLSGGVDSALTAALCAHALGPENVLGIMMPTAFTPIEDMKDAEEVASMLGINTERIDIDEILKAFVSAIKTDVRSESLKIPIANLRARIRMLILYFYANAYNYLVAGTGDRSETLIGYFTKYGDGAADFFPIRHLYKTQVRELARHVGIPKRIAMKPSSPQLYPGHKLSDELPLDYDQLDLVLIGLFDLKLTPERVSQMTNVPLSIVEEILERHRRTEHKRKSPASLIE
ncbi:MAG: NAD+ synthase [Nitrososphaerota archaeon]|nr:NAD+ synthase [Candidatus Bathyarchaeota archaeon]MDW8048851.1 NAD+ synthase [Nitrososphaerota archaeon]